MLGAIIGDIVGSQYISRNSRKKDVPLFSSTCYATENTVMMCAVTKACLDAKNDKSKLEMLVLSYIREICSEYPYEFYKTNFRDWIFPEKLFGGDPRLIERFPELARCIYEDISTVTRIVAIPYIADSWEPIKEYSRIVTTATHSCEENIKGAEAFAVTLYLARNVKDLPFIRDYIRQHYYKMNFNLSTLHSSYSWSERCEGVIPQAMVAFFESTSFEDAIRNAISIGGNSHYVATITGALAEAYYGISEEIKQQAIPYIPETLLEIVSDFYGKYKCGSV